MCVNRFFSLCRLPLLMRCDAPGPAFSQLTKDESMVVLHNLTTLCTDLDPQVINTHKNTHTLASVVSWWGVHFSQTDGNWSSFYVFPLQVSAALAGNLGDSIDAEAISALGNESTGMSTGQIKTIKPQDLLNALTTLSTVMGWNEGQAKAIVQSLMSSGGLEVAAFCQSVCRCMFYWFQSRFKLCLWAHQSE